MGVGPPIYLADSGVLSDGSPNTYGLHIHGVLFGFVIAGYDTTATTVEWGLKFLTKHQNVQKKLRRSLRSSFAQKAESGEVPAAIDIAKASVPYLDAVVEEVLRRGATTAANMRVATQ